MPNDLSKIWFWLYPILALPAAIYYLTRLYLYIKHRKNKSNISSTPAKRIDNILKIVQKEPSRRPPVILTGLGTICSLFILGFGILGIYLMIIGKITLRIDMSLILFISLFIILPIWFLVDNLFIQRRYNKLGRSMVAKEAEIILDCDAITAFNYCSKVLDTMRVTIIKKNRPNLLKANLGKSVITVDILGRKGPKARIHILSDSQWLTVKFDAGANQRNIDNFLKELGK
jgi:uncharacterized membrane protein